MHTDYVYTCVYILGVRDVQLYDLWGLAGEDIVDNQNTPLRLNLRVTLRTNLHGQPHHHLPSGHPPNKPGDRNLPLQKPTPLPTPKMAQKSLKSCSCRSLCFHRPWDEELIDSVY